MLQVFRVRQALLDGQCAIMSENVFELGEAALATGHDARGRRLVDREEGDDVRPLFTRLGNLVGRNDGEGDFAGAEQFDRRGACAAG